MKLEIQAFRVDMIMRELETYEARYSFDRHENPPKPTPDEKFNYLHNILSVVRYTIGTPNGISIIEHAKELMEAIEKGESFEFVKHPTRVGYYAYHGVEYSEKGEESHS